MDIQNTLLKVTKIASDPRVKLAEGLLSGLFGKKKSGDPAPVPDRFSLSAFTADLQSNGFRISKGYYYQVYIIIGDQQISNSLMFNCNKVTLPGWRAKTQVGKIYGIPYEIATEIEQDPVFMTFNIDVLHMIEQYFMDTRKQVVFSQDSYSPDYKEHYQFNMVINVTDENFIPQFSYTLANSMFKTVQNVNYGAANHDVSEITVEVVYEFVLCTDVRNERSKVMPTKSGGNPNQLKIGPFSTDISMLNLTKNTITNVPDWFNGATKI
jgi:hypothetical protein